MRLTGRIKALVDVQIDAQALGCPLDNALIPLIVRYADHDLFFVFEFFQIRRGFDVAMEAHEAITFEKQAVFFELHGLVTQLHAKGVIPPVLMEDIHQAGGAEEKTHLPFAHANLESGYHFRGDHVALLDVGGVDEGEILKTAAATQEDGETTNKSDEKPMRSAYNLNHPQIVT